MIKAKKNALFVATIYDFLDKFEVNDMKILQSMGYEVHIIANPYVNQIPGNQKVETPNIDKLGGIKKHGWRCARSPYDKNNIIAFRQLQALLKKENFDIVHCHTPMGGVLARLACEPYRKKGMKVIYTAHGFHFYDGAPKKNWLVYYPIERELSRITDVIITINHEDFSRAKKRFFAKQVYYIPGVGVDTKKFENCVVSKEDKRSELNIPKDAFVLLSVGELAERKNQKVTLLALAKLKEKKKLSDIIYIAAGEGSLKEEYESFIKKENLTAHVKLLGERNDVDELCKAADCFIHMSVREGLGIAPLEGMASGLPLISSYVNGIKDYTEDGKTGITIINPVDANEVMLAIEKMHDNPQFRENCARNNKRVVEQYSIKRTQDVMESIYRNV